MNHLNNMSLQLINQHQMASDTGNIVRYISYHHGFLLQLHLGGNRAARDARQETTIVICGLICALEILFAAKLH